MYGKLVRTLWAPSSFPTCVEWELVYLSDRMWSWAVNRRRLLGGCLYRWERRQNRRVTGCCVLDLHSCTCTVGHHVDTACTIRRLRRSFLPNTAYAWTVNDSVFSFVDWLTRFMIWKLLCTRTGRTGLAMLETWIWSAKTTTYFQIQIYFPVPFSFRFLVECRLPICGISTKIFQGPFS